MSISGQSVISFGVESTHAVGLDASVPYKPSVGLAVNWSSGEGAGQLERSASKSHTLTGGTDSLDLDADFADPTGVVAFTGLKLLTLVAPASNAGDVTINFGATNGWDVAFSGTATLKPGAGVGLLVSGATAYAVTAGTKDIVTVSGTASDVLKVGLGGITA